MLDPIRGGLWDPLGESFELWREGGIMDPILVGNEHFWILEMKFGFICLKVILVFLACS